MHRIVPLLLALLMLGCAQPESVPHPGPDPELGVAPTVIEPEPSRAASPTAVAVAPPAPAASRTPESSSSNEPAASADPSGPGGAAVASPQPSPSAAEPAPRGSESSPGPAGEGDAAPNPIPLLAVADAPGDHGPRGPDWSDLRSVELVEVGNDVRVTLRFEGELPAAPPEGEVPLIGVDIGEEGYQLFVEGGGQSWAAYLDTPEGFAEYPGSFQLVGSALVLQVPFSAVGSPTRAQVRAFVEWSRDSGVAGVLNPTSEDHLDGEPHTFDRAS